MDEQMFCYQCEQAAHGVGCTGRAGACGKSAETADAQDRLTGTLIGFATLLLDIGKPIQPPQALLLLEGLFTTITNVNFDPETVAQLTDKVWKAKQEAFASACPAPSPVGDYDMEKLWQEPDPDVKSLKSFVLFGLRGMAAYSYHARVLDYTDGEIDLFFCTALRAIAQERDKDKLFQLVEDTGRMAYRVMAELDKANTGAFGDPEPVEVPLTIEKGPFIVISGHDLYDAKCLLEQTEGKGINVYTHSEMLPAHGYPELKKRFPHLKGNFGTAWQNQQREFEDIPAPVLFTTNCIMPLRPSYADRVFTTSVVSYPGVTHIGEDRDFSPVIAKALELGGYPEDTLIPGMNGGKFRLNDLPLGTVAGLPRILDVGQCNDAYSAIRIALGLAEAFDCSVNELPLSIILCWFEQKAVCVLMALLALGIRGIRLGPTLPAFLSPGVAAVLQEKYDLRPITTPEADLAACLGRH